MPGPLLDTLKGVRQDVAPVWLMRQAGRGVPCRAWRGTADSAGDAPWCATRLTPSPEAITFQYTEAKPGRVAEAE